MSVRQRAVDLLYAMCDRSNAQQIVAEMLSYLETADYSIREEIVSPMAIMPPTVFLFLVCDSFLALFWGSAWFWVRDSFALASYQHSQWSLSVFRK